MKALIDYAMSFVGIPYLWGGDDPILGVDCSGLVQELLAAAGEDPPGDQTAQALYDHFIKTGSQKVMGAGALAFYGKSEKEITHVVFMVNDWQAIGANGGGSKTVNKEEAAKANAFVKLRPVYYRKDLVAIIMPDYSGYSGAA